MNKVVQHEEHSSNQTVNIGLDLSTTSDEELWEQFTTGHKAPFEQLYFRYVNVLYDYGAKISRDKQLAEDCVQDLFTYFWQRQHELPLVKAVKPYLLVSLKRRVHHKLNGKQSDALNSYEPLDAEAHGFVPTAAENPDDTIYIKEAFEQLSEKQKEVLYLRFYNKLSFEEVAEVMGVQVKAIYKLSARAISVLKHSIAHPVFQWILLAILAS